MFPVVYLETACAVFVLCYSSTCAEEVCGRVRLCVHIVPDPGHICMHWFEFLLVANMRVSSHATTLFA